MLLSALADMQQDGNVFRDAGLLPPSTLEALVLLPTRPVTQLVHSRIVTCQVFSSKLEALALFSARAKAEPVPILAYLCSVTRQTLLHLT